MDKENLNIPEGHFFPVAGKDKLWGFGVILLAAAMIGIVAIDRNYLTFRTAETDYLGVYVKEAQRFLDGAPLLVRYHPPLYPITLALIQSLVQDWFVTGLFLSWVAGIVVLAMSFVLFYQLGGRYAAWGSLFGLGVSSSFVSHSALATSDMFFLALYYSCFFFVLQAIRTKSNKLWGVAGGVLGLALLTRSSCLPLLVLFVFPWIQFLPLHTRFKNFRWFLIGLLLPLLVWGSIATLTSSPFVPTHSHYNVAVTYFSEGGIHRFSGEAEWQFLGKFDNILEVFAYDPVKIGIIYAKDFYYMLKQNFARNAVVAFPLNLFAFPGLLLLFFRSRRPSDFLRSFQFLFLVAVLMQIALMNFVAWQPRHFLFLVPIFGAGVGLCFKNILEAIRFRSLQCAMLLVLLPFIIVGIRDSVGTTHKKLHSEDQELGEAVPEIKNWLTPNSFVVVRRPHIPFYTQSQQVFFPMVDTLGDLRATLQAEWKGEPIYLYYGRDEQSRRPQFKELKSPENSPAWLEPVTKSKTPGLWVLYRFKPNLNCKEMGAVRGK